MGTATRILRQEHQPILQMLDATEEVVRRLKRGGRVSPEILTGLLEFFRVFAERFHDRKEEDLLFPLLQQKGVPRTSGCIGVMLAEHEQERSLVWQMAETVDACASGNAEAVRAWAEVARSYATLLRQHLHREHNVLYMMAENLLTEADQNELAEAFAKEEKKLGTDTHEHLNALVEKLTRDIQST